VDGDATAIGSAVDAVLDNALRYAPPTGHVRVTAGVAADAAWIEIADDGPGLPPELRRLAGQRFWRGPQALGEGSGLGLAIAVRLITLQGGAFNLADGLPRAGGCGLAVRLSWPLRQA
jgi:signal transduction histidine kinase